MRRILFMSLLSALLFSLSGCAIRPQLAVNSKLTSVSIDKATNDIEHCLNQAKYQLEGHQAAAARDSRAAMVSSNAASAASGLVSGTANIPGLNVSGSANQGLRDALNNMLTDRSSDHAYREIVERCLSEKGYRVTGWS